MRLLRPMLCCVLVVVATVASPATASAGRLTQRQADRFMIALAQEVNRHPFTGQVAGSAEPGSCRLRRRSRAECALRFRHQTDGVCSVAVALRLRHRRLRTRVGSVSCRGDRG